ncbi:AAA family ATPase [Beggiatoa leptomitoformis]|uniref:AAA family ATPase n=1 Tax=Beggiatoa leptomitoformis TaxID=288004 RepID=A0A2N9YFU3_9GAMM|nr:AAA family ATPase [Beggiatoa leptomitoformis]ALG68324.1 AAA family ATPase [Beggiatoa leptomitoformis]AUI69360.1 AAA family ATPase [Beggiatoa leptomitoformis]
MNEDNKRLLLEKIVSLEKALILETDPAERFKLNHQIKGCKQQLLELNSAIDDNPSIDIKITIGTADTRPIKQQIEADKKARLDTLRKGQNPYPSSYNALPVQSPVFVGRDEEITNIYARYNKADKPACISIIGERRIGKTSLLNQIIHYLSRLEKLVLISFSAQAWKPNTENDFFAGLQRCLYSNFKENNSQPCFSNFLNEKAKHGYQFLLVIDEFEAFCENTFVNAQFLGKLRALSENDDYKLGYLLSSKVSLSDLATQHKTESSSFHNVFYSQVISLLKTQNVQILTQTIWQHSTDKPLPNEVNIQQYAGEHPLLLQLILRQLWQDADAESATNENQLKIQCNEIFKGLWERRTEAEKNLLILIARREKSGNSYLIGELQQRGLLLLNNQLFSSQFSIFILEQPEATQTMQKETEVEISKEKEKTMKTALTVLHEAITQVPAVKYALGIVGIAAAVAIIQLFLKDLRIALISVMLMLIFMGFLFLFAKLGDTIPAKAKNVFIWFILLLFITSCVFLTTSVFFDIPMPLKTLMLKPL